MDEVVKAAARYKHGHEAKWNVLDYDVFSDSVNKIKFKSEIRCMNFSLASE